MLKHNIQLLVKNTITVEHKYVFVIYCHVFGDLTRDFEFVIGFNGRF
jgi:hypothetical protein